MEYCVNGNVMPAVEMRLCSGESVYTQRGGMCWMSEGIDMATNTKGGFMRGLGRMFAGESMFMATYTARRNGAMVAFASTVPGEIYQLDVDYMGPMICQKGAFLCAENSVNISVVFSKKFRAGLFGGEGFILEKIEGHGMAFLEADGNLVEKELAPGEVIKVDTGNIVAFQEGMDYDIEMIKGGMNIFMGGEGLFLTKLTGPGKVLLQTQNFSEFAGRVAQFIPSSGN